MAILGTVMCLNCGPVSECIPNGSHYTHCSKCRVEIADSAKRQHLAGLKGLTIEERLSKIEEQLYNHSLLDHNPGLVKY